MKLTLRVQAVQRTRRGSICRYRVDGLPQGQEADIANFGAPYRDDWRLLTIRGGVQSPWIGHYVSADEALTSNIRLLA